VDHALNIYFEKVPQAKISMSAGKDYSQWARYIERRHAVTYKGLTPQLLRQWSRRWHEQQRKAKAGAASPTRRRGRRSVVPKDVIAWLATQVKLALDEGRIGLDRVMIRAVIIEVLSQHEDHRHLLASYGGTFTCSYDWLAKRIKEWGLSWRTATTAARKLPDNWRELGEQFQHRLAYVIKTEPTRRGFVGQIIPKPLVVNS
jgi:hypothetical protein